MLTFRTRTVNLKKKRSLTVVVKLIDLLVTEDRIVNRWPAPSFVIYTE